MCYVGISNECGGCVGINDGRQLRLDGLNLSKLMKFLRSRDDGDHHWPVKMIIISQAVCGRNSLTILANEKRKREKKKERERERKRRLEYDNVNDYRFFDRAFV